MNQPPEIERIRAGKNFMTIALLIIDMQQGSFTEATPRYDTEGLVSRLNRLAAKIRKANGNVVFIQHDGIEGDVHHPMQPGWQLLLGLNFEREDELVRKTSCDSFLNTGLASILSASSVDTLVVTGCATDYCVDTTVRSALAHSYRTIAPRDGHTTADKPHLRAQNIIEHHNFVWSTFLSPVGSASIPCCEDILS